MDAWLALIERLGGPVVGVVAIVWWLTQKLIPAYQEQNRNLMAMFRDELAAERAMHREELGKVFAMYSDLSDAIRSCGVKKEA